MGRGTDEIGVRELRQHASRYISCVEEGATLEITRHGRPVARMVPVGQSGDPVGALIAEGALRAEDEPGDLLDVIPTRPTAGDKLPSEELSRMRDEERW